MWYIEDCKMAAAADTYDDFEDLITCGICMNPFDQRDPRGLPCLHAFCLDCIQQVYDKATPLKKQRRLKCPICQQIISLPTNSSNELPKYFQAQQLQDVLDKRKSEKSQIQCSMCGVGNITAFCFTCAVTFCESCEKVHQTSRRYQNHVTVKVTKDTMTALMCSTHDQPVESFCTECLVSVCKRCLGTDHKEHNIEDFCINTNPKIQNVVNSSTCNDSLLQNLDEVKRIQEGFNAHITSVLDDVTATKSEILQQLDDQEKAIRSEVTKYQTQTNSCLNDHMTKIQSTIEHNGTITSRCDKICVPLPDYTLITVQNQDKYLLEQTSGYKEQQCIVQPLREYSFVKESQSVSLGHLSFKYKDNALSSTASQNQQMPSEKSTVNKRVLSLRVSNRKPKHDWLTVYPKPANQNNQDTTVYPKPANQNNQDTTLMWKLLSYGENTRITDVTFLANGDILTIRSKRTESDILLHNQQGQGKTLPFNVVNISNPCSVACHMSTSTFAIGHGISPLYSYSLFSQTSGIWSSTTFNLDGNLCPWAMAFTIDRDLVIQTGFGGTLVKYTASGTKVWSKVTHDSWVVAVDEQNRIIVPHHGKACVSVYDTDGCQLFTLPKWTDNFGYTVPFVSSGGVCTDSNCNILVANKTRQSVIMFSPSGEYLKEVLKVDGNPCCISLFQDTYLVVSTDDGKVYFFKL